MVGTLYPFSFIKNSVVFNFVYFLLWCFFLCPSFYHLNLRDEKMYYYRVEKSDSAMNEE